MSGNGSDPALLSEVNLLPPIANQEVWAAGVTYLRSKVARMEESKDAGGGTFYDKVYDAPRPELFFKATPHRVVGPGQAAERAGERHLFHQRIFRLARHPDEQSSHDHADRRRVLDRRANPFSHARELSRGLPAAAPPRCAARRAGCRRAAACGRGATGAARPEPRGFDRWLESSNMLGVNCFPVISRSPVAPLPASRAGGSPSARGHGHDANSPRHPAGVGGCRAVKLSSGSAPACTVRRRRR